MLAEKKFLATYIGDKKGEKKPMTPTLQQKAYCHLFCRQSRRLRLFICCQSFFSVDCHHYRTNQFPFFFPDSKNKRTGLRSTYRNTLDLSKNMNAIPL